MTTTERMVYWTDGQSDLSLCEQMPGERDEDAIARGTAILVDIGGELGEGEIKIGAYVE